MLRKIAARAQKTPVLFIFLFCCLMYFKPLSGIYLAGWDTFDLHTVHFLYAADIWKLESLIPTWNPLVLSGNPVLTNLFNSSIWGPIDLAFILLSSLIDSFFVAKLIVFFPLFCFSISLYMLSGYWRIKEEYRPALAILPAIITFIPVYGQIAFLYSFAFFSLLVLFLYQENVDGSRTPSSGRSLNIFLKTIFLASLFIKGYFYLNICALFFSAVLLGLIIWDRREASRLFLVNGFFFTIPILFYLIFHLEGLLAWKGLYQEFVGDLVIDEPRMRQLQLMERFTVPDIYGLFYQLFWGHNSWFQGLGALWFLVPVGLFVSIKRKVFSRAVAILALIVIVFSLTFSMKASILENIILQIPLIGSFRWAFFNLSLVGLFVSPLVVVAAAELEDLFKNHRRQYRRAVYIFLIIFAAYTQITHKKSYYKERFNKETIGRQRHLQNPYKEKELINEVDYDFQNYQWLSHKTPISHGYDNVSSIFYWRQKDFVFNKYFVSFPARLQHIENDRRSAFTSDNEYLDSIIDQVDLEGDYFLVSKNVSLPEEKEPVEADHPEINFSATGFSIEVEKQRPGKEAVVITQNFHPGWQAFVNGKRTSIFPVNKTFLGIFLDDEGKNRIEFYFLPKTFWVLLAFYLFLISIAILLFFRRRPKTAG